MATTNETTIKNTLGTINTALANAFNKFRDKNKQQDTNITNLQNAVNVMTGGFSYRGALNFKDANPNQKGLRNGTGTEVGCGGTNGNTTLSIRSDNLLTDFVTDKDPDKALEKGDAVINEFDNREWWYNGSKGISLATSAVSVATETILGIVKSKNGQIDMNYHDAKAGGISVDGNGQMFVNGFKLLATKHDEFVAAQTKLVNEFIANHETALGEMGTALSTIITTLNNVTAV